MIKKLLCKLGFHNFVKYICFFGETVEDKRPDGFTYVHYKHGSMSTCVCSRCCKKGNDYEAKRTEWVACLYREDAKAAIEKIERDGCFRGETGKWSTLKI